MRKNLTWFRVEEVYCTTSPEEVDATSDPVMLEEVWKGMSSTDASHSGRFQEGCGPVIPSPS